MHFAVAVKTKIYETVAATGEAPDAPRVAELLGAEPAEVEAAFGRLAAKRLLVFQPGTTTKIQMAPPFSGVPTPFRVRVGERSYFANCVWDALGVAAALHADAVVDASDGHTGEPMRLEVRNGRPVSTECAIHFAVPAAHWWDEIVHT